MVVQSHSWLSFQNALDSESCSFRSSAIWLAAHFPFHQAPFRFRLSCSPFFISFPLHFILRSKKKPSHIFDTLRISSEKSKFITYKFCVPYNCRTQFHLTFCHYITRIFFQFPIICYPFPFECLTSCAFTILSTISQLNDDSSIL